MKTIKSWMSHNPFKVVFLTFLFTILPVIAAVRDDWLPWCITLFLLFAIAWAIGVWRHGRTLVSLLVIAALLTIPAMPAKAVKAAAIGVGVVVICIGGICVYKVVKFCQNKFPPKGSGTNAPTELTASGEASGDEYAGAYEYSSMGSCYVLPPTVNSFPYEDLSQNPTTFTLNVMVRPEGVVTSMTANNDEGTTQTWNEFQTEMAEHGLFLTGHPSAQPQFSRNGIFCDSSQVPLEFEPFTGKVTHGTGKHLSRIVIERSPNLIEWHRLLILEESEGSFKVVDTTREGQMFYRVSVL